MPAETGSGWTTLARLRELSRASWAKGQLLRELAAPTGAYPRRRPLKRPTAAQLRTDYSAAQAWAAELYAAAGNYALETAEVGRTTIGPNRLPAAAVFATVQDEIAFAGKTREAERFRTIAAGLRELDPLLADWSARHPLQLLDLGEAALTAARVALWLRGHPSPGGYVRQLSLPGVHTKFVETHRRTIDEMWSVLVSPGADVRDDLLSADAEGFPASEEHVAPGQSRPRTPAARFAARHGFLHPPEQVRFRLLDPSIPALGSARDITVTAEAFATLSLPVRSVIATENLVNFLALPDRSGTLALFGGGYGFSALRDAAWLGNCDVLYWGDLDTHGFRILDQLRSVHPHVASVLMDTETLLAHRDAWGQESTPSRAALRRLTAAEASVYAALGNDLYGQSVRLEQELVRWDWALERLAP